MAERADARLDGRGLLRRAGRLVRLETLDQIRDVGKLLLEVALVALQPLEDVLAAVPPAPEGRPAESAAVLMMSVHVHLPSTRVRKASTTTCVCLRAFAQARSNSWPAGVSSYLRFAGPGSFASHSDFTSPSSSSARSTRYRPPSSGRSPGNSSAARSTRAYPCAGCSARSRRSAGSRNRSTRPRTCHCPCASRQRVLGPCLCAK